jgi:hypothetical protein
MAILHQKNGADYFTATGRWLGAPGHTQTCVPLNRFQKDGLEARQVLITPVAAAVSPL